MRGRPSPSVLAVAVCALAFPRMVTAQQSTVVSEADASQMMSEFDLIVDVRGESSYRESHVSGAVLMSQTSLEGCENRRVAFYCSSGAASESAANSYARSAASDDAYAIGTLERLRQAGVPTEAGGPSDESRRPCASASSSSAPDQTVLVAALALGIGGAALLFGAVLVWRCACRKQSAATTTVAKSEEEATAEKKLPKEAPNSFA